MEGQLNINTTSAHIKGERGRGCSEGTGSWKAAESQNYPTVHVELTKIEFPLMFLLLIVAGGNVCSVSDSMSQDEGTQGRALKSVCDQLTGTLGSQTVITNSKSTQRAD